MARALRLGITLMVVGAVAAFGLGLTYAATRKRIKAYEREVEAKACLNAMPGVDSPAELKEEQKLEKELGGKKDNTEIQKVFSCEGGYILSVQTKGYGGPLVIAVGIGKDGKVLGVSSVSSKETMGVGSRVLEPSFLGKYKGKSASDPLEVGRDVQGVTGATITSKAATAAVKAAVEAYRKISKGSGGRGN